MPKPVHHLDGQQLSKCADQLRKRREKSDLNGGRVENEGKRGKIILPNALHDCLEGAVPNTVPTAALSDVFGSFQRVHHETANEEKNSIVTVP